MFKVRIRVRIRICIEVTSRIQIRIKVMRIRNTDAWGRTLYLGKNGDTLQVDGEGPEDLHGGELVVEHQGEQRARTQQEFDPECTKKTSVHGVHLWFILSYLNV